VRERKNALTWQAKAALLSHQGDGEIMIFQVQQGCLREELEALYQKYNDKKYIRYDPIKYIYRFENPSECELVGLITSSLAFGRVTQIFNAMDRLLEIVHNEPLQYILTLGHAPEEQLLLFKYRFVTGLDVFRFFKVIQTVLRIHGSLDGFARQHYRSGHLMDLVETFIASFSDVHYLIPCSLQGSPCKRLFMYFRWMVRSDNIDLGLWDFIDVSELVMPLDTHIFQASTALGLTSRRTPSLAAALEITESLREYSRDDPVKYDWGLSRQGIIANNFCGDRTLP
jgi:uncharacterized protein (TIGR02757 family)